MAAYVIYQAEVLDPERVRGVQAGGGRKCPPGRRHVHRARRAHRCARGRGTCGRTVVVEFPDRGTALEWYQGDYAKARALREGAAIARMYVVDGVAP